MHTKPDRSMATEIIHVSSGHADKGEMLLHRRRRHLAAKSLDRCNVDISISEVERISI